MLAINSRILFAAAVGSLVTVSGQDLGVLRVTPTGVADPTAEVRIVFDRPVAADLDRAIDPAELVRLVPAVPGTLEWRDPITLRFRPARPLAANTEYTVTIFDTFEAMDGSSLPEPYTFSFRVHGPRALTGLPTNDRRTNNPPQVAPTTPFQVVFSDPPDRDGLERRASIALEAGCGGPRLVRVRITDSDPVARTDPSAFRFAGNYRHEEAADRRRVVTMVPVTPLPRDCAGDLVLPRELDLDGSSDYLRWSFRTYGDFGFVAQCGRRINRAYCPTGPITLQFTNPVRGADVQRYLRILPTLEYTVRDTLSERHRWVLEAKLAPRTSYAIFPDSALRDVYGQPLQRRAGRPVRTTGYAPAVSYVFGRQLVERTGYRTIPVSFINVDTLRVSTAPIPRSLEHRFVGTAAWNLRDAWSLVAGRTTERHLPVEGEADTWSTQGVALPIFDARRPGSPSLVAVRVSGDTTRNDRIVLAQVTDLAVHAKIGAREGAVWVTGADDGMPRTGVRVTLRDNGGRVIASGTTSTRGLVRLTDFAPDTADTSTEQWSWGAEGYVEAVLGPDRALVAISQYDPDLSPWRYNVRPAFGTDRLPEAAGVFTERDIYRPGDPVYAKAIVRDGLLGNLRSPPSGDSLRWQFTDRERGTLHDTVVTLTEFGTAEQTFVIPAGAALGTYTVSAQRNTHEEWRTVASSAYRVAEYRPPEFLVTVMADSAPRFAGDSIDFAVEARYLFGAGMGRAALTWTMRQRPTSVSGWSIPGARGYMLGERGYWWEDRETPGVRVTQQGTDTLDQGGHHAVRLAVRAPTGGRPAQATFEATVTDVNRQTVAARAAVVVHPAAFYVGVKPEGRDYFWRAGDPESLSVIAVTPQGARVPGVAVSGSIVRREWHRVRRVRNGVARIVGEWVSDTVGGCLVRTTAEPVTCTFTPPAGGQYVLRFRAVDAAGRIASTSFYRWATGTDWVPWNDESQFKMDVFPDQTNYTVGDTAEILFASPFTDAEAWITVEREGVIEERRMRIESGTTTLHLPITEAHVPNAFVSIVVTRGRSAPPGTPGDPGRPTIRVGYAELSVTPEAKRLAVTVDPLASEYGPGDSAQIRVTVRDQTGRGVPSEVTLWAVDAGVLSLTGFRTPDPISLLYRSRGVGMRLASNLASVAEQLLQEGERLDVDKGTDPGGGGGGDGGDILRSEFRATAFFLGSVRTADDGDIVATAHLPDNLTTFRVMAVAVTRGDRYGSGESEFLVTRPLLARPALPRFLRAGDAFTAGVVVNHRLGGTPTVTVTASAEDVRLTDPPDRRLALDAGRGSEVRFGFVGEASDSARFRFDVRGADMADAVRVAIPVEPFYHPRTHTVAGVLYDSTVASFALPANLDPGASSLTFDMGTSPLAAMRGAFQTLRVYPYYCTEQLSSTAGPLIALHTAQRRAGWENLTPDDALDQIGLAVRTIVRRQRADGGIGYWHGDDWTTAWLTAYAGQVLLSARALGVPVPDSAVSAVGNYLDGFLNGSTRGQFFVARWRDEVTVDFAERLAAAEFLRRAGRPNLGAENTLLRAAAQMAWEDRVRLAELLHESGRPADARRLLERAWSDVRVDGDRAVLPGDLHHDFYFRSRTRPLARLLTATVTVQPDHPLVGPLVAALIDRGRAGTATWWNTQDYAHVILALADFEATQRAASGRGVVITTANDTSTITRGDGPLLRWTDDLTDLAVAEPDGTFRVDTRLQTVAPGPPIFYHLSVSEIPNSPPVRPDQNGFEVERWYEEFETGRPITRVEAGQLVRVRVRLVTDTPRYFVVLDDPLPAGLEAVDLSLRTAARMDGADRSEREPVDDPDVTGYYGRWEYGWWSPFNHREMRDDRVVYYATVLGRGSYTATYVARATTPGTFVVPPTHAEEMYNPAVHGRSGGATFVVTPTAR